MLSTDGIPRRKSIKFLKSLLTNSSLMCIMFEYNKVKRLAFTYEVTSVMGQYVSVGSFSSLSYAIDARTDWLYRAFRFIVMCGGALT